MEKITKLLKFPKDLVDLIEEYQKKNFITSFSSAVFELLRKGLKS